MKVSHNRVLGFSLYSKFPIKLTELDLKLFKDRLYKWLLMKACYFIQEFEKSPDES